MTLSPAFFRLIFMVLSSLFMIVFALNTQPVPTPWTYLWGSTLGIGVGALLIGIEVIFKRLNLKTFNITLLGLFFGYLMALTLSHLFNSFLIVTGFNISYPVIEALKICLFLFGAYFGVLLTLRASDEIFVSLPFVRFTPTGGQIKGIILDISALYDSRLIDLAASGIVDKRLIMPRFLLKQLHQESETSEDSRAKRALDVVKKLEVLPNLGLRYQDTDFPEVKEMPEKILRLARFLNADVLSADINRVQTALAIAEDVRSINVHALSHALKPLMQKGESLKIKIQRYGKEEHQGVGYLDDGTMVVVNGGGDFVGSILNANVLSAKHTSSGRMIFCNVAEES